MENKVDISLKDNTVEVTATSKYCVDDDAVLASAATTGALAAGAYVAGPAITAAVTTSLIGELAFAGEIEIKSGDTSSMFNISLPDLSIKGGEICNMNKESNTETCVSLSREDGIWTDRLSYLGQTCLTIKETKTEELKTQDDDKTDVSVDMYEDYCPIKNKGNEIGQSQNESHIIEKSKKDNLIYFQAVENVVGFADLLKNRDNMTSSEFDRAIAARAVNIVSMFKNMHGSTNIISHFIIDGKIHSKDIVKYIIDNINLFIPGIGNSIRESISEILIRHDMETIIKHLILSYMEMLNPLLGKVKIIYSIAVTCWHLFDRVRIVDTNIQGIELPITVRSTYHASLKKGIYEVYWGEINDPMFNIDVHTNNYNNKNDAANAAGNRYLEQLKKEAYSCTGLRYELFCDDISNSPKGMFSSYKDIKLHNTLLNRWLKDENMTDIDKFLYKDYISGGDHKSWWDKHKTEDPITYLYNILKYGKETSYSDSEYRKHIIEKNKHRSDELDQDHKKFELNERHNYDNNIGQYNRLNISIFMNGLMFMNDISIGKLYETEIGSLTSIATDMIVYCDKNIDMIVKDPYSYILNKFKDFISTYKQIWLTSVVSSHLTNTLCVLIPIADKLTGDALSFVSANISMITSMVISSFHVKKMKYNRDYMFNIVANTIRVNISFIGNMIAKLLFHSTGIISKFSGFLPGIIIYSVVRVVKHYAIDIDNELSNRIKKTVNLTKREKVRNINRSVTRIRKATIVLKNPRFCNSYRKYHAEKIINKVNKRSRRR